MKLIDKAGKPVDIADADVPAAYQSGNYGIPKGSKVPLVGEDGIGYVDAEHVGDALAQGQRIAAPTEVHEAELQAKYGDAAGMAAAAGEGAARGLTLGGSDLAAIYGTKLVAGDKASQSVREHLQGTKDANPITAGVGEVAGMIAPAVLSGGGSVAAEGAVGAARAGVEGASLLGKGAEAASIVGKGAEALRGAAVVAPEAAQATSAIAKVKSGIGAVADVLGAPMAGISKVGTWAEKGAGKLLGESAENLGARIAQKAAAKGFQGAAEGALFGAANEVDESVLGDHELAGQKLLAAVGHGALLGGVLGSFAGGVSELGHEIVGRLAPQLEKQAGEQAVHALNARKAFTSKIDDVAGGRAAIGDDLLNKVGVEVGDTAKTLQPKIEEHLTRSLDQLAEHVDAVADTQVPLGDVYKALNTRATEFEKMAGYESAAAKMRQQSENLMRIFGAGGPDGVADMSKVLNTKVPLGDLLKQRRLLEGTIDFQNGKVVNQGLKAAGRTLEDVIMQHGEAVAKAQGGAWAKGYQEAKSQVSRAYLLRDVVNDSVDRMQANASHSLTDKVMGAAFGAAGITHGPIGVPMGWAAANVSKQIREKGRATAAALLNKLAAIGGVERAATRFDREVDRGLAQVFKPGARVAPKLADKAFETKATAKVPSGSYAQRVAAVTKAVGSPDAHIEATQNAVAGIAAHAPGVANSFQSAALRATTYLQTQIPKGHVNTSSLTPHATNDGDNVPHYAKADFNRKFDVVNGGPAVVVDHLAKGILTKGEVDAADHVYPQAMQELREKVMAQLADQKHPLPASKEMQLVQVLKIPRKGTLLDPGLVKSMQQTFAPAGKPNAPPPAPKRVLGTALSAASILTGQSKV